jgi:hypothetical protein
LDFELGNEGDDAFGESFDAEELEMGMELFGLKAAVNGIDEVDDDEEGQVEELENMMRRMVAVKGESTLP